MFIVHNLGRLSIEMVLMYLFARLQRQCHKNQCHYQVSKSLLSKESIVIAIKVSLGKPFVSYICVHLSSVYEFKYRREINKQLYHLKIFLPVFFCYSINCQNLRSCGLVSPIFLKNILNIMLYGIQKQVITNLGINSYKSYIFIVVSDSKVDFLRKREDTAFHLLCFVYTSSSSSVVPPARISLTLSRHFSLSFITSGRSSGLHPISSLSCCMYVQAGRPAFAQLYVGVHRNTSLMSSSLLLQQCPACLVCLTWIVFLMGGRWPYSWCFVGCCLQDLFNIAHSILVFIHGVVKLKKYVIKFSGLPFFWWYSTKSAVFSFCNCCVPV